LTDVLHNYYWPTTMAQWSTGTEYNVRLKICSLPKLKAFVGLFIYYAAAILKISRIACLSEICVNFALRGWNNWCANFHGRRSNIRWVGEWVQLKMCRHFYRIHQISNQKQDQRLTPISLSINLHTKKKESVDVVVVYRMLQSGSFHIDRYVYRFDPVELRTSGGGLAADRRRRSTDHRHHVQYRMSSTLLERDPHDPHSGNTDRSLIHAAAVNLQSSDR